MSSSISAIRVSDSFSRHMSYAAYADARGSLAVAFATVAYFDLAEDISNMDVLSRREIGGLGHVRQTALSPEQAVGLLELQRAGQADLLLENIVRPRNRGFMFGTDGRLYDVLMDVWHPRVIDEEFTLDANTLHEAMWVARSRVFYNIAPRNLDDAPVVLSTSIAHEIAAGVRSGTVNAMTGEFPLLATAA